MSVYLIGDVQGCQAALKRLLNTIDFSPSRDTLYFLGDLVNRGPDSLGVLRQLRQWSGSAYALLGNHDIHLLAVHAGILPLHASDTVQDVLNAPDAAELMDWLRDRPFAFHEHGWLMVHAGVLPSWDVAQTLDLSQELHMALTDADWVEHLRAFFGSQPAHWRDDWPRTERLRVAVNALTRMRLCSAEGEMEFKTKDNIEAAPPGFMAWFDIPNRRTENVPVAFGHWSTLGGLQRPDLLALDTGCVWGGSLSAAEISPRGSVQRGGVY
jgi:bis(5'-nucleosyl)-tetraphosphatase (symmetrical)